MNSEGHASVYDVAAYILHHCGEMTTMKLQKLVYYSQAWSLVWDERRLFPERIEAWTNGPVVPALYSSHRGAFKVHSCSRGDASKLDTKAKRTVNAVCKFYAPRTSQWLSDLTHLEAPWRDARAGLAADQRGSTEIKPSALAEYYGSLPKKT